MTGAKAFRPHDAAARLSGPEKRTDSSGAVLFRFALLYPATVKVVGGFPWRWRSSIVSNARSRRRV